RAIFVPPPPPPPPHPAAMRSTPASAAPAVPALFQGLRGIRPTSKSVGSSHLTCPPSALQLGDEFGRELVERFQHRVGAGQRLWRGRVIPVGDRHDGHPGGAGGE